MEKAIDLFSKNGVESTSIQDITDACGISKGAFYLSFKSKDDLLVEITDYFIKKFMAKQNELLDESSNKERLLTNYFYYNFKLLEEHHSFIAMCMRENFQPMNNEVIDKIKEFNDFQNKVLLSIIEQSFGNKVDKLKYDLLLLIRGLLFSYTEFITTRPNIIDLQKLSSSLAEKVTIIADNSKLHYVTEDLWNEADYFVYDEANSKEKIIALLNQLDEQKDHSPLIEETLQLLKDELIKDQPSLALLTGLVSNLQSHEQFSLLIFSMKQYMAKEFKISK